MFLLCNTDLCMDVKTLLRTDRVTRIGKNYRGVLMRDGEDHYIRDIVSRWAPAKENNTEAYIRHVSDYTGIAPNKVLGSPQEHPTQWLLIGYAMAVVENGKALPAVPMLKGFELAYGQ